MDNEKIIDEGTQSQTEENAGSKLAVNNANIPPQTVTPGEYDQKRKPFLRFLRFILLFVVSILFLSGMILYIIYGVPAIRESTPRQHKEFVNSKDLKKDQNYTKLIGPLSKDVQRLTVKFDAYTSGQSYIVINTTDNKFYLYKNKQLVREGSCSTGSYKKLQTASGKTWTFKTPRGKFLIQGKRTHPAWHRPDWSFIEEGVPIPPKDSPLRWEAGVLGDYAMDLGDSYMIHGTIYKRFLGMPVTHGCVRLNDEDLEVVFNTLNVGSKVYIF